MSFGLPSVRQYYEKILKLRNSKFKFNFVSEEAVVKLPKDLDGNNVACMDNLSGKSLKDGTTVLAKLISQISNLSIKYSIFQKEPPKIIDPYTYFL